MSDTKKNVIKEIISYVLIIGGVLLIKAFVMSPIIVNGDSMNKTLKDNDIMILNKWSYHFDEVERFDIVVVEDEDGYLIKRVIGLPGDIIYYMNNNLYINGKKYNEKYAYGVTDYFGEVKLKKDEYFILGDNRENSLDSRKFGPVKRDQILGKTHYVLFPFKRFGEVE